jgi:L-lactate dehydrogenase
MKIVQVTGQDPRKVIGSGTLLETARLVRYIAELLELSDRSIHVSVVGEHGPTAVALLSSVRVLGMTLQDYLGRVTGGSVPVNVQRLNETFSREAFSIFQGKGYTSTGVSAAICSGE